MENDNKIHITAKRITPNTQGVVRLTPEAQEALAEVVNETNLSIKEVASLIIVQAVEKRLICYDREEEN